MSIRVASNIFVYPSCGCLLTDKIGSYLSICIVSIHILKFVGPTNDPPLQHKKRVDPFSESPSKQPEVQDEYILLGDQQKFGPSVKYHWKKVIMPRSKMVRTQFAITCMYSFLKKSQNNSSRLNK